VLLLFGLALVLNANTVSAANATTINTGPNVTSVNPVNNSIILKSQTIKVNFSQTIKAGTKPIVLKNSAGTVIYTKTSISNRTLSITPTSALPTGVKYFLFLPWGSISNLQGKYNTYYKTCFTVSPITLAQMKDGLTRAQTFYYKNGRLPHYVSYSTFNIPITQFQQIIATQGLSIKTPPVTTSVALLATSLTWNTTSQYVKAVNIFNWVRDNIGYSFYYGTKYGAAGTLSHMTGNCCDTANLMVALARDAGISARYKYGYCQFNSGTWYYHVWADLYVNGKWYAADGISYRNSLGVINNWNTSTFKFIDVYNTLPF
jgi:transglutaminase-like putative cysteine protease